VRSRPRLGSSSRMASAVSRQSSLRSTNSSGSLRSDLGPPRTRTRSSASGGSVIRLTRPSDRSELPYTIQVPQHAE
jgi:hypothetical protein